MELSHLCDPNLSNKMPKREIYFPFDVLSNILVRLPSTSIIRFQTVSKYWCYVIRVSEVLNARSKSSLMSIQLSTNVDSGNLTHFNFDDEGKTMKSIHKINLQGMLSYNFSNMVNGLTCVYGRKSTTNLYMLNPTTFETSKYRKRKIKGLRIDYDQITLGFNPSTGLHKLIRIYSHVKTSSYLYEIREVGVSFKGKWNVGGKIPYDVDFDNSVYLNGAIYWKINPWSPSLNKGKTLAFYILKLDLEEVKFEIITPTLQNEFDHCDYQVCHWEYDFTLSEENGKLYVLHYCCRSNYLFGWRLKEREGDCVWNIVFRVNLVESMAERKPDCILQKPFVVGIADGKVLIRDIKDGKGVYIYDLVHKKLSEHWDVHCGSIHLEDGLRRMLFYRKE